MTAAEKALSESTDKSKNAALQTVINTAKAALNGAEAEKKRAKDFLDRLE